MNRDFTLIKYRELLETLRRKNYAFVRFDESVSSQQSTVFSPQRKINDASTVNYQQLVCILRHDVDKLPLNSLATALIEHELGIKGSYYFRIVPESFDETIIKKIAGLGHEVGYHYEDVDLVSRQSAVGSQQSGIPQSGRRHQEASIKYPASRDQRSEVGSRDQNDSEAIKQFNNETLIDSAYELFKENLAKLRTIVPVTTICMHGSPLSKYDNKLIWTKYNYRELGLTGEPYFDMDWNEFAYLTDTGRRWDGESVSVRDKVAPSSILPLGGKKFKKTQDIIDALERNEFPDRVMITVHPQRWSDDVMPWLKELVLQNLKNVVKRVVVLVRK